MAVTNEDIRERFEIGQDGVIRWRKLDLSQVPNWAKPIGRFFNKRAGTQVKFFSRNNGEQSAVKIGGQMVYESRIRKVLLGQTAQDVSVNLKRNAQRRAEEQKAAEAKRLAQPSREQAEREARRNRHIRSALGFVQQNTGAWHHSDGRVWSPAFFISPEAQRAGADFDEMESGNG